MITGSETNTTDVVKSLFIAPVSKCSFCDTVMCECVTATSKKRDPAQAKKSPKAKKHATTLKRLKQLFKEASDDAPLSTWH